MTAPAPRNPRPDPGDVVAPDLSGRRALVCGATRGIGRACAEALAARGASVTLAARDAGRLEEVRASLATGAAATHHALAVDFSEPAAVRDAVARHLDETSDAGPITILVNNTGGPAPGPILTARAEDFLAAFGQHVLVNHLLVQTLHPGMKEARHGRVVNIVSTSVREPIPGLGVSNTIRAAVAGWAKTLSNEVAADGITVNNVLPGSTWTDRYTSLVDAWATRSGVSFEEMTERLREAIPAGRFADPAETAATVAFLASPAAAYVTGQSIAVDGGRLHSI